MKKKKIHWLLVNTKYIFIRPPKKGKFTCQMINASFNVFDLIAEAI